MWVAGCLGDSAMREGIEALCHWQRSGLRGVKIGSYFGLVGGEVWGRRGRLGGNGRSGLVYWDRWIS